MKISINWLKEYIQTESNPVEISEILTNLGLEVEKIDSFESVKGGLEGVVAGEEIAENPQMGSSMLQTTPQENNRGQRSRYTYQPKKIKVPKQYRLISKIFYLSFINFSKLGLKYFGPFITLPFSL